MCVCLCVRCDVWLLCVLMFDLLVLIVGVGFGLMNVGCWLLLVDL